MLRRGVVALTLVLVPGVAGAGERVDWVKVDPAFEGATFVNDDSVCATCHEDYLEAYKSTRHARAFEATSVGNCESCHGPRSLHVDDPEVGEVWQDLGAAAQSAVCQQCHAGGSKLHFQATAHAANEVSCSSCHLVSERNSQQALLIREDPTSTCVSCHADVGAQMMRTSHHPLREGQMTCASCHDVHGSTQPSLLKGSGSNDSCYSCHTEKRGPFLWEHAPARENCGNCHEPHGSNHRSMLTTKESFSCLSCHSYGGHINLPRYNRTSNPYGTGCVNCHVTVHGSNHPSGAKLTR